MLRDLESKKTAKILMHRAQQLMLTQVSLNRKNENQEHVKRVCCHHMVVGTSRGHM
jgi:hypothetical protein